MTVLYVSISDYRDNKGNLNWEGFEQAQIENGEKCCECKAMITFPKGFSTICYSCRDMEENHEEIYHHHNVRCPLCGFTEGHDEVSECGLFAEGEHDVDCSSCGHTYGVDVCVKYTYISPAMLSDPESEEDE